MIYYPVLMSCVDYLVRGINKRLRFISRKALTDMIEEYISYYNNRRVQRRLGILTPAEKHCLYVAA